MTPASLLAAFRTEMQDTAAPYAWEDAEVYRYLDDAQKMFCRLTDGISDASTPSVVEIEVAAGDTWLNLHPAILKIRAATRDSDGAPVNVLNFEDLEGRDVRLDGRTDRLRSVIAGMEENKLRLMATAASDDTLRLLVFRLPLTTLTGAEDQELEIGAQHHYHLLLWAKSLALLKQDSEVFDKSKAEEFEAAFRTYCEMAKVEQGRKRHKVRTVAYGGI